MIAKAIGPQNTVGAMGISPSTVEIAVSIMGRRREVEAAITAAQPELVRLVRAEVRLDGIVGQELHGHSDRSTLEVDIHLQVSASEPSPRAAVVLSSDSGKILGSTLSAPGAIRSTDAHGHASIRCALPQLPVNKGRYRIGVYLLCSSGRFVYQWVDPLAHIHLSASDSHQGAWRMPGQWQTLPAAPPTA